MTAHPTPGKFTISTLLPRAWKIFLPNAGSYVGATVLFIVILFAGNRLINHLFDEGESPLSQTQPLPVQLPGLSAEEAQMLSEQMAQVEKTQGPLNVILGGAFALGFAIMASAGISGNRVLLRDFLEGFDRYASATMVNILVTLFGAVGLMLFVLPMFLVIVLYMPVYFYIHDQEMVAWQAMEASRRRVQSNLLQWCLLGLIVLLMNLAGAALCIVGFLFTYPLTKIMVGLAYAESEGRLFPGAEPADEEL